MAMISNIIAMITQVLARNIKADYALWLSAWSVLATFMGIYISNFAVRMLKGR
jgi:hypothetical protein